MKELKLGLLFVFFFFLSDIDCQRWNLNGRTSNERKMPRTGSYLAEETNGAKSSEINGHVKNQTMKPSSRGGIGAWGYVSIILFVILSGLGIYYTIIFYPIVCKKQRMYHVMGSTTGNACYAYPTALREVERVMWDSRPHAVLGPRRPIPTKPLLLALCKGTTGKPQKEHTTPDSPPSSTPSPPQTRLSPSRTLFAPDLRRIRPPMNCGRESAPRRAPAAVPRPPYRRGRRSRTAETPPSACRRTRPPGPGSEETGPVHRRH